MNSPELPFKLIGGGTEQVAIANRIGAISRIKHLTGVDLTKKTQYFLLALDIEMYQRWYKDKPKNHKIDEEWCQHAAQVVKEMEGSKVNWEGNTDVSNRIRAIFKESENVPFINSASKGSWEPNKSKLGPIQPFLEAFARWFKNTKKGEKT